MTWNLKEFRSLCNNRGIPNTKVYQDALYSRDLQAHDFGSKALAVWEHLFSTSQEVMVGDNEWNETQFNSESNIEAALQASHSLADIIAQILNIVILGGHFAQGNVSIHKVHQELNRRGIAANVATAIQAFLSSPEYQYTNGFVNTIKHRHLIGTDFQAEFGAGKRNEDGMRFKSFTYNGIVFPTTWLSDVVNVTIPNISNYVINIGNETNDYLR